MMNANAYTVIILAAGKGTRLEHLTANKPKAMVSFMGKPLLYRQLEVFNKEGITDITIVGGYHASFLTLPGIRLLINEQFAETNMVYTLFCAEQVMCSGNDLIISYGDIVFEPRVLSALLESKAPVNVIIDKGWQQLWTKRMHNPLDDAETLKLADGNRITELGKKPRSYSEIDGQYIGLIRISASVVNRFIETWREIDANGIYDGKDKNNMYMTSFLQYLIDSGWDVRAVDINHGWLEIDTVEDLTKYEHMESVGELKQFYSFT
jgi:L-glutamine-phosphate cytidylyltransferase